MAHKYYMKRALFIGINYTKTNVELKGCINDVMNMKNYITKVYNVNTGNTKLLCDNYTQDLRPTYNNILKAFSWLTLKVKAGDSLFLHYSGHGTYVRDINNDEQDKRDECICPIDYQTKGFIIDDIINEKLVKKVPKNVKLTCIFDCCYSGTVLDLKYSLKTQLSRTSIINNNLIKETIL